MIDKRVREGMLGEDPEIYGYKAYVAPFRFHLQQPPNGFKQYSIVNLYSSFSASYGRTG